MRNFYCIDPENIENYEKAKADNFKGWEIHHRLETHSSDGERRLVDISAAELKALGMYYNRPPEELIFLTKSEHSSLRKPSKETKKKISEALKGENNPMYGKHLPEETKKKVSKTMKGKPKTEETKKRMSEAQKGHPVSEATKKKLSEMNKGKYKGENNGMYGKKHSKEARKKLSLTHKGRRWFNNGKISKFCYECPDGFVPGRV